MNNLKRSTKKAHHFLHRVSLDVDAAVLEGTRAARGRIGRREARVRGGDSHVADGEVVAAVGVPWVGQVECHQAVGAQLLHEDRHKLLARLRSSRRVDTRKLVFFSGFRAALFFQ